MKVALSMGGSSDVNSMVRGLKEEIKELRNELEHGGMVGDSTDAKEIIKELEEEVEQKDREIKRLRSGWSDSEETVTGLRNTMSWRDKEIKELKEKEEKRMDERKELLKKTWIAEENKKAEEEGRSLRLQADAELQKKKEAAEEERKEVDENWSKSHSFRFGGPETWKEAARRTRMEMDECRLRTLREIGRLRAELSKKGGEAEALRAELIIAAKKEKGWGTQARHLGRPPQTPQQTPRK